MARQRGARRGIVLLAGMALLLGTLPAAQAQQLSPTQRLLELKKQQEQEQAGGTGGAAQGEQGQEPGAAGGAMRIEATGVASYRQDDAARSRNEAIEAAQREAVEQASGVFIESESMMRNFELVQDDVLSRSKGFIRNYEVINEERDGPFYNVTIEAEVVRSAFIEDLNESLENLYRRVGRPRVMLVIEEFEAGAAPAAAEGEGEGGNGQPAPVDTGLNVLEKEVRKLLLKQGFTFVDARALAGGSLVEQAEKGRDTGRQSLLDLARTTKAEIVMLGRGRLSDQGRLQQFHIVEASVGLDVVRTTTGQVMASEVETAKALHINPETAAVQALQKAAEAITPAIMEQVTYLWIKEKNEGARVELVVKNISYGDLLTLRKLLSNEIRGVRQVRQRSYSDGTALLELDTRDPPDRLAESLFQTQLGEFSLEIEDVTASSLVVALKKR